MQHGNLVHRIKELHETYVRRHHTQRAYHSSMPMHGTISTATIQAVELRQKGKYGEIPNGVPQHLYSQ